MLNCQIIGLLVLTLQCCLLFFLYDQSTPPSAPLSAPPGGASRAAPHSVSSSLQAGPLLRGLVSSLSLPPGASSPSSCLSKEALMHPREPPSGDERLHSLLVDLAEQFETAYVNCLDPVLRLEPECEFSNLKPYRAVIRRLHQHTREQNQSFVTVQYGCLDGKSNDPIYGALMKLEPRYPLLNWHAILVEPAFMDKLKKTYETFAETYGLVPEQMRYAEGAVNTPENIDAAGKCHFYKVVPGGECPQKKEWMTQISGLSEKGLRGFFKKNFEKCVRDIEMQCWSPGQLLAAHGFHMKRSTVLSRDSGARERGVVRGSGKEEPLYTGDVHCLDTSKEGGLQKIDLLVVDVEGYDGDLVKSTLNELCPDLWPAVILYEDKVMRYNSGVRHHKSTIEADDIIEFLERRGYYCMLNGEDVVAMRIGYSVGDLVHTSPLKRREGLSWFHPRRGPLEL